VLTTTSRLPAVLLLELLAETELVEGVLVLAGAPARRRPLAVLFGLLVLLGLLS
jgi:hypothetical protein